MVVQVDAVQSTGSGGGGNNNPSISRGGRGGSQGVVIHLLMTYKIATLTNL